MYSNEELVKLVNAYSKLSNEDQKKEIDNKISDLIRSLRLINRDDNLNVNTLSFDNNSYASTLYLLYGLEEEIGKVLEKSYKLNN